MNRAEKAEFIEDVRGAFEATGFVILTDFKGSTVNQLDQLRRACESAGGKFRIVKNTLTRIALADTDKSKLAKHFKGNVGVVFSGEDPVAMAKVFKEQIKSIKTLEVRAGFFEGDVLDAQGVEAVAELPSREELLSKLLATLNEGPRQVVSVIQAPARDLLYLLRNYASKLEEGA